MTAFAGIHLRTQAALRGQYSGGGDSVVTKQQLPQKKVRATAAIGNKNNYLASLGAR